MTSKDEQPTTSAEETTAHVLRAANRLSHVPDRIELLIEEPVRSQPRPLTRSERKALLADLRDAEERVGIQEAEAVQQVHAKRAELGRLIITARQRGLSYREIGKAIERSSVYCLNWARFAAERQDCDLVRGRALIHRAVEGS